jgi:ribonuclease P/MRP protein subunit POP5
MKRIKRRYLAMQLECEGTPTERELLDAVWASVTRLYGEVGASLTGLALIDFDVEHKIAVVRCTLASLPSVRASLAALTRVADREATMHVLAVSGTIKALSSHF